eukprot:scaffold22558_cov116-Cylindrotheca_fusiformis.AAC.6
MRIIPSWLVVNKDDFLSTIAATTPESCQGTLRLMKTSYCCCHQGGGGDDDDTESITMLESNYNDDDVDSWMIMATTTDDIVDAASEGCHGSYRSKNTFPETTTTRERKDGSVASSSYTGGCTIFGFETIELQKKGSNSNEFIKPEDNSDDEKQRKKMKRTTHFMDEDMMELLPTV